MKRQLTTFALIGLNLLLAVLFLRAPLTAASAGQQSAGQQEIITTTSPAKLTQPLRLTIYQQMPVSVTIGNAAFARTIPMTFEVGLNLVVTQSMTTTIPTSVTFQVAHSQTTLLPIEFGLRRQISATVVVTPLGTLITTTERITAETNLTTSLPTPTAAITTATNSQLPTPNATLTPTAAPLESTVNITANLRAGPSTTFDVIGQATPGQKVTVAGISTDGLFFLLNNGQWIAVGLLDNVPTNPLLATDELIASLRQPTAAPPVINQPASPTPTVTPLPTRSLLPTPTPTPLGEGPSVTNNANLRAGPGTEFATIGGTVASQAITVVGRNQDGTWFQLDNGGWVAAFLVANPPPLATIPVVNPNQTTIPGTSSPVTTTTGITSTTPLTTTQPVTP